MEKLQCNMKIHIGQLLIYGYKRKYSYITEVQWKILLCYSYIQAVTYEALSVHLSIYMATEGKSIKQLIIWSGSSLKNYDFIVFCSVVYSAETCRMNVSWWIN